MTTEARAYLIFGMVFNGFAVVFAVRHQWGWATLFVLGWAIYGYLYVQAVKRGPR